MVNLIGDMARAVGLPRLKRAAGVVTRRLPIPQPLLMVGPGASLRLAQALADFGHKKVFVVTDAVIVKLGLLQPTLDRASITRAAYAATRPNIRGVGGISILRKIPSAPFPAARRFRHRPAPA